MAAANNQAACLRQNLLDAKCGRELSAQCMALSEEGQQMRMVSLLKAHRAMLLDTIHEYQKALDSLDYLLFQTEKNQKAGTAL